jgi:penicillin-binding protein 2
VARFTAQRFRFPAWRSRPACSALSAGRRGRAPDRLHRPHQPGREETDRGLGRRGQANYRGTDHIGKLGLEQSYEKQLHGTTGYEEVETGRRPRGAPLDRPPTPGNT